MSSPLERSYRRALRLLPERYRRIWEDDMVAAFLDSAEDSTRTRPNPAEWLSVVSLAVRLRLNGAHAAPRWAIWYHVANAIALLVLLYQSVAGTATAGYTVAQLVRLAPLDPGPWYEPALLIRFIGLLWLPAFAGLVLRRVRAARILASLAALASLGVNVAILQAYGQQDLGLGDASRWGWLVVSAAIVFAAPTDATVSPWLWFGAWLVGSTVVLAYLLRTLNLSPFDSWSWLRVGNIANVSSLALIIALAIALARAWPMRVTSSPPYWLFALGIVAAGIGGVRLARWSQREVPHVVGPVDSQAIAAGGYVMAPAPMTVATVLSMVQVALALIALAVALLGWHRAITQPTQPPNSTVDTSRALLRGDPS